MVGVALQSGRHAGRRAGRFVGSGEPYPGHHRYVDSVKGRDHYHGRSSGRPWRTLRRVLRSSVVQRAGIVGFARGSLWPEQMAVLPVTHSGGRFWGYGPRDKALPLILGADPVPPAAWVKTAGRTNVYQVPWAHSMSGTQYPVVFEDGPPLIPVGSVATCDSTPGSWNTTTTTASGQLIYVHPTGSTVPGANGRRYEITRRAYGIHSLQLPAVHIDGLHFSKLGAKDGQSIGENGSIRNSLISYCHIHHSVLYKNTIARRLVAYYEIDLSPLGLSASIPITNYHGETTQDFQGLHSDQLYVVRKSYGQGYFSHSAGTAGAVNGSAKNVYMLNSTFNVIPDTLENVWLEFQSGLGTLPSHPMVVYRDVTLNNIVLKGVRGLVNVNAGSATVTDMRVAHSATAPSNNGYCLGAVKLRNSTLVLDNSIFTSFKVNDAVGAELLDSVVWKGRNITGDTTEATYAAADRNVFYADGNNQWWKYNNVQYTNLPAWQGAPPALDAGSAQADPLLGDYANNNWSFGAGSPVDTGGRTAGSRKSLPAPNWSRLKRAWGRGFLGIDGTGI